MFIPAPRWCANRLGRFGWFVITFFAAGARLKELRQETAGEILEQIPHGPRETILPRMIWTDIYCAWYSGRSRMPERAGLLLCRRGGVPQAWRLSSFRARLCLSGATPGEREELTFRRVSFAARCAGLLGQSGTRWVLRRNPDAAIGSVARDRPSRPRR
jgi:hypothetical protein